MPILLEDLINQLPREMEEKVEGAKDRLRQRIRDVLSEETRLFLQRKSRGRRGRTAPINIQISLKPGLPATLEPEDMQSIEEKHRLSIILAPFRQSLTALVESGKCATEYLLPLLRRDPTARDLLNSGEIHLEGAWHYSAHLLDRLSKFELTKFILRVDQDVLGVYFDRNQSLFGEPEPCIELYWGVIGLVARDLGVEAADLTYVVLAHEYGHAFTHAAVDADGEWWTSAKFRCSSHELKEGLAQFYAEVVCHRIEDVSPGALKAYQALLPYQPAAYHTQERWKGYTPEHIRSAMLQSRRLAPKAELEPFEAFLQMEKQRLSAD
jgi:hypothetical protein